MTKQVTDNIEPLIQLVDMNFSHVDGVYKVALLKTVANYYENLTAAQMQDAMMHNIFGKLK